MRILFYLIFFFICLSIQSLWAENKLSDISEPQKIRNSFSDIYKSNDGHFWNLLSRQGKHTYLQGFFDGFRLLSKKVRNSRRCEFNTKKDVAFESYNLNHIKYTMVEVLTLLDEFYQNKKNLTIPISEFLTHLADEEM